MTQYYCDLYILKNSYNLSLSSLKLALSQRYAKITPTISTKFEKFKNHIAEQTNYDYFAWRNTTTKTN